MTLNEEKLESKGFHLSKASAALLSVLVVVLVIAEGLIIGLMGRPECAANSPVDIITNKPIPASTTTSTTTTTITTTPGTTETSDNVPWRNYRLPLNLIPYEYEISLRPILEAVDVILNKYIFIGSSTVRYTCVEPTKFIILHTRHLKYNLSDWTLTKTSGATIPLRDMKFYEPNEFVILETEEPCDQGEKYELKVMDFEGDFAADNRGLYRSEYINKDGQRVVIATSQMEGIEARETFPCFDEPALKATFLVKLWHRTDSNYFSMSNMPITSTKEEIINGQPWTETIFEETVVMQTYLLAFVISDFTYIESTSSRGVQTDIYARPSFVEAGDANYAAMITPLQLDFFEEYIGIQYPLSKSIQVSVPDMRVGAMENWGLVIYREAGLMYNVSRTPDTDKLYITNTIAHELAHQYFGNLVTCEWWNQIWLNEGFATYYAYLGEFSVQPTWKAKERFILKEMRTAFKIDELTTSRPMVQDEVSSASDVQLVFDSISYSKGGSIVRMVNSFMGEDNFVNATKDYLLAHQYGVASQDQLFSYWEKYTSHLSLPTEFTTIMETWTLQMGFPLVIVSDRDPLTNTFSVRQEYYLRNADATPIQTPGSLKYGYKWYIPFTFKRGSNLAKDAELIWLTPYSSVRLSETDFILGNSEVNGYFRVNYERASWDRITNRLDSPFYTDIPEGNRAQLLDDAFTFASSGRLDPVVPIVMSSYLHRDNSYMAWETFYQNIKYYEYMLGRTEVYGTFKNYVLELVVPSLYDIYGWEHGPITDEKLLERLTRDIGVDASCYYEYADCVQTAVDYFGKWMASPEDWEVMPSSQRNSILCAAIRAGGIEEWNFAWKRYNASSDSWKSSLRYGLSCSKDPWVINRYLGYILDRDTIANQDASSALQYVGGQEYATNIAWAFLVNNWFELTVSFSESTLSSFINSIVKRFSTEYELKLLEDFKQMIPDLNGFGVTIDSAIETTIANIKWRKENEAHLTQWFYDNVENVS